MIKPELVIRLYVSRLFMQQQVMDFYDTSLFNVVIQQGRFRTKSVDFLGVDDSIFLQPNPHKDAYLVIPEENF